MEQFSSGIVALAIISVRREITASTELFFSLLIRLRDILRIPNYHRILILLANFMSVSDVDVADQY